jgi:predicted metal-binding membrane protein
VTTLLMRRRPSAETLLLTGVAVVAAAALWWWGASPGARYLDHQRHTASGGTALGVALFALAWLLMVVVTMLPGAAPLLRVFRTTTRQRPRGRLLALAVVGGFLGVWMAAGLAAAGADHLVRALAAPAPGHAHPAGAGGRLLLAAGLWAAGIYQLSGLADRCLRGCRSPRSFVAGHWTGRPDVVRQSLAVGVHYGLSCLGCCAALMAVMLIVGMGNPLWMYLLAGLAILQRRLPFGRELMRVTGVALIAAAAAALFLGFPSMPGR